MIEYIAGEVESLSPTEAVLDTGGIGYGVQITLSDYSRLQGMARTKLYIHEVIRDDAHTLYGFLTREARHYFRLLISVSGVGPNTARLILSAMTAEQLAMVIASGDDAPLRAVKGIGGKTAQRIIVDLKDKIKGAEQTLSTSIAAAEATYDDALAALVTLGFNQLQSQKALRKVFMAEPGATAEQAIKAAIKML